MDFNEEGIMICVNDVHPEKASYPIEVTEEGIITCVRDEQHKNTQSPINCMLLLSLTTDKLTFLKKQSPSRALPLTIFDDICIFGDLITSRIILMN